MRIGDVLRELENAHPDDDVRVWKDGLRVIAVRGGKEPPFARPLPKKAVVAVRHQQRLKPKMWHTPYIAAPEPSEVYHLLDIDRSYLIMQDQQILYWNLIGVCGYQVPRVQNMDKYLSKETLGRRFCGSCSRVLERRKSHA